ncbi:MAG: porphobilinogen synthase, partial [Candidatus Puniceispirillum sp.]
MSRGQYPSTRMRRTRMAAFSRRMVAETRLDCADLIWPLFVIEGTAQREPIASLPGVFRHSIDLLVEQAARAVALNIPAIAVFPSIDNSLKDAAGSLACDGHNLVCRAVAAVKAAYPDLGIICDVALDPFTSHGHDGLLRDDVVLNDETVEILCEQAVYQAAKYASGFYGPFRDAVRAGASLGKTGKSTYQMDPANSDEAMHEIALDLAEGADMVIIKPGMPYLDILARAKAEFGVPC